MAESTKPNHCVEMRLGACGVGGVGLVCRQKVLCGEIRQIVGCDVNWWNETLFFVCWNFQDALQCGRAACYIACFFLFCFLFEPDAFLKVGENAVSCSLFCCLVHNTFLCHPSTDASGHFQKKTCMTNNRKFRRKINPPNLCWESRPVDGTLWVWRCNKWVHSGFSRSHPCVVHLELQFFLINILVLVSVPFDTGRPTTFTLCGFWLDAALLLCSQEAAPLPRPTLFLCWGQKPLSAANSASPATLSTSPPTTSWRRRPASTPASVSSPHSAAARQTCSCTVGMNGRERNYSCVAANFDGAFA